MMKKPILYVVMAGFLALSSCSSDDDGTALIDFSVTFSTGTISLSEEDASKEVVLTFSRPASESGIITVSFTGADADYGVDFITDPVATSGSIALPVEVGDTGATFTFNKLTDPIEGTTKSVSFTLNGFSNATWVNGTTATAVVSFTPIPASSGTIDVEMGGPNEPNMVFIDLSSGQQSTARRDTWEIGLYNGTENRVFLNSSLLVSAAEITGETDINTVNTSTVLAEPLELNSLNITTFELEEVTVTTVEELLVGLPVSYTQYGNTEAGISFTDNAEGALEGTAFAEISTTAEENFVYIVGLGAEIPTTSPDPGAIATTGEHRGFMKVRVLSDGNGYTIQYAELDATTYNEVTIAKDPTKNLTPFSLVNGAAAAAEPATEAWDIQFPSVFSYYGPFSGTTAGVTFSDYAVHNTLGDVGLYRVVIADGVPSYSEFNMTNVDESLLDYDNRGIIGSDWRVSGFSGPPTVKDDRYYVLKDASGNYYKLRFTAVLSPEGTRGYPQFVYEKL